jgi:hypothetical protein
MRLIRLLLVAAALGSAACPAPNETSHTAPPAPKEAKVGQDEARKLILAKYRHLFRNAYRRDPETGQFGAYPELDESSFRYVEARGDAWLVRAEPLAGWIVRGRVAKSGDWVDLSTVEFAKH